MGIVKLFKPSQCLTAICHCVAIELFIMFILPLIVSTLDTNKSYI